MLLIFIHHFLYHFLPLILIYYEANTLQWRAQITDLKICMNRLWTRATFPKYWGTRHWPSVRTRTGSIRNVGGVEQRRVYVPYWLFWLQELGKANVSTVALVWMTLALRCGLAGTWLSFCGCYSQPRPISNSIRGASLGAAWTVLFGG